MTLQSATICTIFHQREFSNVSNIGLGLGFQTDSKFRTHQRQWGCKTALTKIVFTNLQLGRLAVTIFEMLVAKSLQEASNERR